MLKFALIRFLMYKVTSFQELFSRETSVDKFIKCCQKFCNIFKKTLLAEPFPVKISELQPTLLFKKQGLSQIIAKVAVGKYSLK